MTSVPRILAITPENAGREPERAVAWFRELAQGHADSDLPASLLAIQVRDHDADTDQLRTLVLDLLQLPGAARYRWIINQNRALANELSLAGVHLRSSALYPGPRPDNPANPGLPQGLVGVSTHSLGEIRSATAAGFDYAVFGPVFDTPSKRAFGAPQGIPTLTRVCAAASLPVLAIGGIDAETAPGALAAGAFGFAAMRALGDATMAARLCRLAAEQDKPTGTIHGRRTP